MDMSAEEIVKIALVLVCNYKLEAMFSIVGGFFLVFMACFSCGVFWVKDIESLGYNS